jgi:hypothetical protein
MSLFDLEPRLISREESVVFNLIIRTLELGTDKLINIVIYFIFYLHRFQTP